MLRDFHPYKLTHQVVEELLVPPVGCILVLLVHGSKVQFVKILASFLVINMMDQFVTVALSLQPPPDSEIKHFMGKT